jgi:demethylmenaquinone methyltransferase/2-methoxy-6-polyprenyl-1,4-benzoquinol methylase
MTKDPYQKFAAHYDRFIGPLTNALRHIGMKMYPVIPGMKVLEVGCGTGTNLMLYRQAGCCVYGIDRSPSMLEIARTKLGEEAEVQLGDASNMPYQDDFFDLVMAMFALHEMPGKIRPLVMREMARVTKQEGRILIMDYHPGPIRFPEGWIYRAIMIFFEKAAGHDHFSNYRDFLSRKGLPGLIENQKLVLDREKIIIAGNIAFFLIKPNEVFSNRH